MKYFLRLFLLFFISFGLSYAEKKSEVSVFDLFNDSTSKKSSTSGFVPNKKKNSSGFIPNDTRESTFNVSPFQKQNSSNYDKPIAKSLFASYINTPSKGYVGELIPLQIRIIVAREFESIKITTISKEDGELRDFLPKWTKEGDNVFTKTILFQAKKPLKNLPSFYVELVGKNGTLESTTLPNDEINIIALNDDEGRFVHVFAQDLEIKKFKTNTFDDKSLITVMEINAQNANLDDIKFQNVIKQGIDTKSGNYINSTIYYFIIIPKDRQSIQASYFNTTFNKFEIINLPVVIELDDLSTQVDLNPKKSRFGLYKDIAIISLILLFLALFIIRKRYIFAIVATILALYLLYMKLSLSSVFINKNTGVRILPTENSTIFYTTTKVESVEKLNIVKPYVKILLPNKKIGWVKDEDIIKN